MQKQEIIKEYNNDILSNMYKKIVNKNLKEVVCSLQLDESLIIDEGLQVIAEDGLIKAMNDVRNMEIDFYILAGLYIQKDCLEYLKDCYLSKFDIPMYSKR